MNTFESLAIRYKNNRLEVLDQRLLPHQECWLISKTPQDMVDYITQLSVRGAPLIGVSAALALAHFAENGACPDEIKMAAEQLRGARPTAVNLTNALDRMLAADDLSEEAERLMNEEVERCELMAEYGATLIQSGENILTLATPGIGTALGVIKKAHERGKNIHVYVDETRPLLQGGRLTTWELERLRIPYTLICDNMAAGLMREGKIQRVLVGADRIALNGDFANKIGTYSTAVLAKFHDIPFHPVAPISTIDRSCLGGTHIPIEHRKAAEVQGVQGSFGEIKWSPKKAPGYNPSFDVTPVELIESLILDIGILSKETIMQKGIEKILCGQ